MGLKFTVLYLLVLREAGEGGLIGPSFLVRVARKVGADLFKRGFQFLHKKPFKSEISND